MRKGSFQMLRNVGQMVSAAFFSKCSTIVTICFSLMLVSASVHAQVDQVQSSTPKTDTVRTAGTTKSDADVKPSIDESHPLFKLLEVAYKSRSALDDIDDYRCVFSKRELLRNNKLLKTTMNLKLREKPFSVYLNFVDLNAGREVLYVQGKNGNNLLVHEAGVKAFLGTFQISPTGTDALAENRYPVTSIGLRIMLDTVIKQWESEGKYDGITSQKRTATLPTRENCTAYEAVHKPFKEFKFHTTRLYIDDETGLAIGVQQYGFPAKNEKEPPLIEEYFYGQLKTNVKLTDQDFDPKNPNYGFK